MKYCEHDYPVNSECPECLLEYERKEHAKTKRELAEAMEIATNLALLCYASGCGIGTMTMLKYEQMKNKETQKNALHSTSV